MIICFLANGCEEIEALTPVDCLRRCGKKVVTVGVGGVFITGAHGITVTADIEASELGSLNELEMVILPGGMPGTENLRNSDTVIKTIKYAVSRNIPIAAICAAPSILGGLGLLKGKKAVIYSGMESELVGAEVSYDAVAADGNIITGCGMGSTLEFSHAIVSKLISKERADALMKSLNVRERTF